MSISQPIRIQLTYTVSSHVLTPCKLSIFDSDIFHKNVLSFQSDYAGSTVNRHISPETATDICKSFKCTQYMKSNLTIAHLNVRSLYPKVDMMNDLLSRNDIDIMCITESWLNEKLSNTNISIPGYQIFRRDRDSKGGGVLLYVRDNLHACHRDRKSVV